MIKQSLILCYNPFVLKADIRGFKNHKIMNSDLFLNGIRTNLRQGNMQGLQLHLSRILNKANEPTCSPRNRTEINLEAVKVFRVLGRQTEAVNLCDASISNIPAECFDLLCALKRVRSLLYLDAGDFSAARSLIDDTDGLELVLQGNQSLVTRQDTQVSVETWLISTEIALAQSDFISAQQYFDKAITRLSSEEAQLRRKRPSLMEKRKLEQYYHDLSQILNLYGLTLGLLTGDNDARASILDLSETVVLENEIAFQKKKLPNVPLQSKLKCLLGAWDGQSQPLGIPLPEAHRWAAFGSPEKFLKAFAVIPAVAAAGEPETAMVGANSSAITSLPLGNVPVGEFPATADNTALLNITLALLERLANSFTRVEQVLPDVTSYLKGETKVDFSERHFAGHLLDTDLFSLLHNVKKLNFTGYIKFLWNPSLFQGAVHKGFLPDIVLSGEATLYGIEGFITDAVFKGQSSVGDVKVAQDNLLLIVRMCFSMHTNDTQPDIHAKAVWESSVTDRPRLLKVRENDLVFITSDLDEQIAGVSKEEGESGFFDSQTAVEAETEDRGNMQESRPEDDDHLFSEYVRDEVAAADEPLFMLDGASDGGKTELPEALVAISNLDLQKLECESEQKEKPSEKTAVLDDDDLLDLQL